MRPASAANACTLVARSSSGLAWNSEGREHSQNGREHSIDRIALTSDRRRGFNGAMRRTVTVVSAAALVIYLCATSCLGRLERAGPAHEDVVLAGGIPGTLFLPEPSEGGAAFLDSLPRPERPPAALLMHGFASDRLGLSGLARKLAESGYAVLTIDVQGHGQNRNPYRRSRATGDSFYADLSAAVDYLRASPHVDGSRLVVMGHSMGAEASLDYATRDSGIDGAVMISGGSRLEGPYRPPNALFIFASEDPESIRDHSRRLAARTATVPEIELSRTYGRAPEGTAVRAVEVPDTDHLSIIWSDGAAREIVAWLDGIFGVNLPADRVPGDPRVRVALVIAVAFLLILPGLGQIVGRLVAPMPEPPVRSSAMGLLTLAAALAATMPLLAVGAPGVLLSVEVGDVVVSQFALCGIALLVLLWLQERIPAAALVAGPLSTILGASVAIIAVFALMAPLGVVVHRLTLTPERMLVFLLSALALLPFAVAFQLLLRSGRPLVASLAAVGGRALVLLVLVAGVRIGVMPWVLTFMLPALALAFCFIELLAASIYATSRNVAAIALIDAAWVALIVAVAMPVRI
jgi:dienelactone hydrolase